MKKCVRGVLHSTTNNSGISAFGEYQREVVVDKITKSIIRGRYFFVLVVVPLWFLNPS